MALTTANADEAHKIIETRTELDRALEEHDAHCVELIRRSEDLFETLAELIELERTSPNAGTPSP